MLYMHVSYNNFLHGKNIQVTLFKPHMLVMSRMAVVYVICHKSADASNLNQSVVDRCQL